MTHDNDHDDSIDGSRLKSFDDAIRLLKSKTSDKSVSSGSRATSSASRVVIELLSGVLVGIFIGFYLDKWLGTKPILMAVCTILGALGGMYALYKDVTRT